MSTADLVATRLRTLMSILACPRCRGTLDRVDAVEMHGVLVDADLVRGSCGSVGVVRGSRASFHEDDLGDGWATSGTAEVLVDLDELATGPDGVAQVLGLLGRVDDNMSQEHLDHAASLVYVEATTR